MMQGEGYLHVSAEEPNKMDAGDAYQRA